MSDSAVHDPPDAASFDTRRVVLYDEDCAFCKWILDKVLAWDRRRALRPVPIQSEQGAKLLGDLPPDRWLQSWHLVSPSGEVRSGGAAAAPLVELLPAGKPLAVLFRTFPGLTERAYRFVADNRIGFARVLGIDASCQLRR